MKLKYIASAMACSMLFAGSVFAADEGSGTVKFEGSIIDAPCSISASTQNQIIPMGAISNKSIFSKDGKLKSNFTIKLEDCTVATKKNVTITFSGAAKDGLLALEGTTKGAGIQIDDSYGTPIVLGTASAAVPMLAGENDLKFNAYLKPVAAAASADDIQPGNFTATVTFTLNYL
ncbi:fimbrial protein [Iodobacter sp. CM08]|uniref:fimbrial protein n=1 Tax=Iodobacter sp. CM08 TaxID=3085902 RepID=UPI00298289DD|nr:fimbrial protein [Iodobacter sp. CM08]MDW5415857.1 fimbrial protein [Iodobacter sp. CM08]